MTPQEYFEKTKEYILLEKSNPNWTAYSSDMPEELFFYRISAGKEFDKEVSKIAGEYLKSK